jgi:hypothetical protein
MADSIILSVRATSTPTRPRKGDALTPSTLSSARRLGSKAHRFAHFDLQPWSETAVSKQFV